MGGLMKNQLLKLKLFDLEKIEDLIKPRFKIIWIEHLKHENRLTQQIHSRYHLVLEKERA